MNRGAIQGYRFEPCFTEEELAEIEEGEDEVEPDLGPIGVHATHASLCLMINNPSAATTMQILLLKKVTPTVLLFTVHSNNSYFMKMLSIY